MEKYNEIFKLKDMLEEAGIGYTFNKLYDGYQIKIIYEDELIISIIEHEFSYDNDKDLVEFMYIGTKPISINSYGAFNIIKDILELKNKYNNTGHIIYKIPILIYPHNHIEAKINDDDDFEYLHFINENRFLNVKDWFIAEI